MDTTRESDFTDPSNVNSGQLAASDRSFGKPADPQVSRHFTSRFFIRSMTARSEVITSLARVSNSSPLVGSTPVFSF